MGAVELPSNKFAPIRHLDPTHEPLPHAEASPFITAHPPSQGMEPKDIVRTGYDTLSYSYRQDDDASSVHHTRWANSLVEILPPGARVLDIGCGCGIPVARMLGHVGHHVVGVDISAVQIKRAKELVPEGQFFRADITELVTGSAEEDVQNAVQRGAQFDAVVALYVLIHLPVEEQMALIQQLGNWVKTDGYCMMTVGVTAWTGEDREWLGSDTRMWWSQTSLDNYRKWVRDGGFEIIRDEYVPEDDEDSDGHQFLLLKKCR